MIYEVTIAEKTYRVELVQTGELWSCKLDGREFPLDIVSTQEGVSRCWSMASLMT